jgi:hypothetical protein
MFIKCKFDERQLKVRGDIFKRGFILLVILLFINAFLTDNGIIWADGMWSSIIIAMLPVAVCSIEMIMWDVYITEGNSYSVIAYLLGLLCAILLIYSIVRIVAGESVVSDGQLTKSGVYLLLNAMFVTIYFTFIAKKIYNKRNQKDE